MRFTDRLPTPSAEALAHSQALLARIRARIADARGSIPFSTYMHMALYEPGLGYYVAGLRKFGTAGDFVTAPEISPLFGQCLANPCAQMLATLPQGDILEFGAGSGALAADLLAQLEKLGHLPQHYLILELSPELRERQRHTLLARVPHLLARVRWLDSLPTVPLQGVVVANEVLDAMPVELFRVVDGQARRLRVALAADALAWQIGEQLSLPFAIADLPDGYTSEYNPWLAGWLNSLGATLAAGVALLIDYGYPRQEYYHPERSMGTLLCHYQHRVHDDPLWHPGLQDITASVDFTAVAEAGLAAGFGLAGYTTQANFLTDCGLEACFTAALQAEPGAQYHLAQQVRTLCLPSAMGERFKVLALSKGFTAPLQGFRLGDQIHHLQIQTGR